MFEALNHLRLEQYLATLSVEDRTNFSELASDLRDSYPDSVTMDSVSCSKTARAFWQRYREHVTTECANSATYAFWTSYLDAVQLLLVFVRATRESDWELHLQVIREMMPWFFAYDRTNYSRSVTVFTLELDLGKPTVCIWYNMFYVCDSTLSYIVQVPPGVLVGNDGSETVASCML